MPSSQLFQFQCGIKCVCDRIPMNHRSVRGWCLVDTLHISNAILVIPKCSAFRIKRGKQNAHESTLYLVYEDGVSGVLYGFNSLAPRRSECDSKNVNFNLVLLIGIFRSSHDNVLQWMPQDLTDDKSRLVQLMAWCRQATSHYMSQCWISSLSLYSVARPHFKVLSEVCRLNCYAAYLIL